MMAANKLSKFNGEQKSFPRFYLDLVHLFGERFPWVFLPYDKDMDLTKSLESSQSSFSKEFQFAFKFRQDRVSEAMDVKTTILSCLGSEPFSQIREFTKVNERETATPQFKVCGIVQKLIRVYTTDIAATKNSLETTLILHPTIKLFRELDTLADFFEAKADELDFVAKRQNGEFESQVFLISTFTQKLTGLQFSNIRDKISQETKRSATIFLPTRSADSFKRLAELQGLEEESFKSIEASFPALGQCQPTRRTLFSDTVLPGAPDLFCPTRDPLTRLFFPSPPKTSSQRSEADIQRILLASTQKVEQQDKARKYFSEKRQEIFAAEVRPPSSAPVTFTSILQLVRESISIHSEALAGENVLPVVQMSSLGVDFTPQIAIATLSNTNPRDSQFTDKIAEQEETIRRLRERYSTGGDRKSRENSRERSPQRSESSSRDRSPARGSKGRQQDKVCFQFKREGSCQYGDDCRFAHIAEIASSPTSSPRDTGRRKRSPSPYAPSKTEGGGGGGRRRGGNN